MNVCDTISVSDLAANTQLAGAADGVVWYRSARVRLDAAEAGILVLDFAGVRIATVSWLREAIIALLRHAAAMRPDIVAVVANASSVVLEELQVTLDATNTVVIIATMAQPRVLTDPILLGRVDSALRETLDAIGDRSTFDASVVSKSLPHVRLSAANNRLAALESKGVFRSARRGRARVYTPVLEGLRYGN